ncbi:MAG: hypothetical protein LBR53_01550 [Deltaproteobacteria bacterium]|jgi:hypothetical protein|nr:hypothetical protein [Deltaproteobacteria bacterium]
MPDEVSYYKDIQKFIEIQLKSNFKANNIKNVNIFWGIGELKSNLQTIIKNNPSECSCAKHYAETISPLNVDIFALITDAKHYELLILEIKKVKSVGLHEWSQLIGYCLVSGAKYGILLNINNKTSTRLSELLFFKHHMSHIKTLIDKKVYEHNLGLMYWNSFTQNFEYSNLGELKSLSELSEKLIIEFSN